ncbi:MAG: type IV pilus assembly protein PilM [Parcubacteria group bacterium]|nr:type IV pilus assembly protein PilM [Parcubacteria group bacterium]
MVDFLKQITSSFMSAKNNSVIGIDIGSSFMKVVQLKRKNGKAILETYGELALGPYADAAIGQATQLSPDKITPILLDLLKEANVTTKNAGVSLPLQSSLLSLMKMPNVDEKKLAQMIPIEARKYIPVPVSEVSLDWWVLPKREEQVVDGSDPTEVKKGEGEEKGPGRNMTDVLVVALLNETINDYNTIISSSGLQNAFLELEVFSTVRSTFGHTSAPVLIFDMGARTTKIAIMEYGIIRAQHIINRGSQNITVALSESLGVPIARAEQIKRDVGLVGKGNDADASATAQLIVDHVLTEAQTVLLNYERKHNRMIKQIILTGGGVLLKGLYEKADKEFETEVTYADPFSRTESPAFLAPVLRDAGPEFAVAIGLALRKLEETG